VRSLLATLSGYGNSLALYLFREHAVQRIDVINELGSVGVPGGVSMAWLTVQEAAELLRVPVSWLYERTRTNSVPHVKLGKYLRFDRDELVAWVDEAKRDGRGPSAIRRPTRPVARAAQR
jgi:excisionase family DNA binding protein